MEENRLVIGQLNLSDIQVAVYKEKISYSIKNILLGIITLFIQVYASGCIIMCLLNLIFSFSEIGTFFENISKHATITTMAGLGVIFYITVFILVLLVGFWSISIESFVSRIKKSLKRYKYTIKFMNILTGQYDNNDENIVNFYSDKLESENNISNIISSIIKEKYDINASININRCK